MLTHECRFTFGVVVLDECAGTGSPLEPVGVADYAFLDGGSGFDAIPGVAFLGRSTCSLVLGYRGDGELRETSIEPMKAQATTSRMPKHSPRLSPPPPLPSLSTAFTNPSRLISTRLESGALSIGDPAPSSYSRPKLAWLSTLPTGEHNATR